MSTAERRSKFQTLLRLGGERRYCIRAQLCRFTKALIGIAQNMLGDRAFDFGKQICVGRLPHGLIVSSTHAAADRIAIHTVWTGHAS